MLGVDYARKIAAERRAANGKTLHALKTVASRSLRWRLYRLTQTRLLKARLTRAEVRRLESRAAHGKATGAELANLGHIHFNLGDVSSAYGSWSRAVTIDPDLLEIYERHAYVRWERGYWDEAYELFERAVERQELLAKRQQLDQLPITWLDMGFTMVIGTLAFLDAYVKQRILSNESLERTLIVHSPLRVGNQCYLDYWRGHLPNYICNLEAYETLSPLRRLLRLHHLAWRHPDGRLLSFQQAGVEAEAQWDAEARPPLLRLTDDHRQRGWQTLRDFGIPEGAWFVALHVREAAYHDARNASIATYDRAIDRIVERGGWVIRMGDASMPRLPDLPCVVDYAHSPAKSDWMDVFLWAECRFLIGTSSGPVAVPGTFGVPAVHTNWCPLGLRYWYSNDLCLPKRYQTRAGARPLGFNEIMSSRVGFVMTTEELDVLDVEVVDNTPADIEAVVLEMLERVEGHPVYSAEDDRLQEAFQRIQPSFKYPAPGGRVRMGREYLRANADLLRT